jgi:hypothetical protein
VAEVTLAEPADVTAVAEYKRIFKDVLDSRPSGMRIRLAHAMGKNRSFVSQISNPAYPVPVPVQHLNTIFEVCHFSPQAKAAFLRAYARAHPRRAGRLSETPRERTITHSAIVVLGAARKFGRRRTLTPGKVALISGGGSGHEPLHVGFVGTGMLDAACPGQIFTSPTPDQIVEAAAAVGSNAGVLFIVKNYAGDCMNFEMARNCSKARRPPS